MHVKFHIILIQQNIYRSVINDIWIFPFENLPGKPKEILYDRDPLYWRIPIPYPGLIFCSDVKGISVNKKI